MKLNYKKIFYILLLNHSIAYTTTIPFDQPTFQSNATKINELEPDIAFISCYSQKQTAQIEVNKSILKLVAIFYGNHFLDTIHSLNIYNVPTSKQIIDLIGLLQNDPTVFSPGQIQTISDPSFITQVQAVQNQLNTIHNLLNQPPVAAVATVGNVIQQFLQVNNSIILALENEITLNTTIVNLKNQLSILQNELTTTTTALQTLLDNATNTNSTKDQQIDLLNQELVAYENSVPGVDTALQNLVNSLTAETTAQQIRINQYTQIIANNSRSQQDLQDAQTMIAQLAAQKNDLMQQLTTADTQLANNQTVMTQNNQAIASLQAINMQQAQDLLTAQDTIDQNNQTIASDQATIAQLNQQLAAYQAQQQTDQNALVNANLQIQSLNDQQASLTQQLQSALINAQNLQLHLGQGTSANSALTLQVTQLQSQVNVNATTISQNAALIQSLHGQIANLTAENQALMTQFDSLITNDQSLTARVGSLTTTNQSLTTQINSLNLQVNNLTNANQLLTTQNTTLQAMVTRLTNQVHALGGII